jgi:predicted acylesterase/phospholipase RssA
MKNTFRSTILALIAAWKPIWEQRLSKWYALVIIKKILRRLWWLFHNVFLNKYVRAFTGFVGRIWLSIIILLVGVIFLQVEQARDYLENLQAAKGETLHLVFTHVAAFLAATATWYYLRILLLMTNLSNIKDDGKDWLRPEPVSFDTIQMFSRWLPPVLGALPILSMMIIFSRVVGGGTHVFIQAIGLLVYIGLFYLDHSYVDVNRFEQMRNKFEGVMTQEVDKKYLQTAKDFEMIFPIELSDLRFRHQFIIFCSLMYTISFFVLLTFFSTNLILSRAVGPVAILYGAMITWLFASSFLVYLDYLFKAPLSIVVLLLALFGMSGNNNHQIRIVDYAPYYSKQQDKQTDIKQNFSDWLECRLSQLKTDAQTDSTLSDTTLKIPVYIIAAEGGGIRSAYWTASVLAELEESMPNFTNHIYAISGVSGGSVGAAVFTAFYHDNFPIHDSTLLHRLSQSFFRRDFLTPLLAAGVGPDLVQKFLPVGINRFDRAQYLEDAWALDYQRVSIQEGIISNRDTSMLNRPFLHLWKNGITLSFNHHVPILCLNATRVETGQKAVLSPLNLSNNPYFTEVIDLQEMIYRNLPIKTAASMSARFPIITPPATITRKDNPTTDLANFVDGGYIDNTGLETAFSILSTLADSTIKDIHRVEFKVLFIRNSEPQVSGDYVPPLKGIYELKAPINAFINSWDNNIGPKLTLAGEYLKGKKGFVDPKLHIIQLDRGVGTIPLGWELSQKAEERIDRQIENLNFYWQKDAFFAPKNRYVKPKIER